MSTSPKLLPQDDASFRKILGVDFFAGTGEQAVARMKSGGLLVVPAAPALKNLSTDSGYREALLAADLCITDSSFMVLIWNSLEHDDIHRLSGLRYLRSLLREPEVRAPGNTFWIMANATSASRNHAWLDSEGVLIPKEYIYIAPMYGKTVIDPELIERLIELRPHDIIIAIGGGVQERLGHHLKQMLDYHPAIHCLGAAIGFLSGDQAAIPVWVDDHGMGWLSRCYFDPWTFVPRYLRATMLLPLMLRYRSELPPLDKQS